MDEWEVPERTVARGGEQNPEPLGNTMFLFKNPLLWSGFGFAVVSIALLALWPAGESAGYRELLASLLGSVAITIILIAVVEAKHLSAALGETAQRIVNDSARALDRKFDHSFDILDQCKQSGLIAVHQPRQADEGKKTIYSAITAEIGRTAHLDVIGISALDFFSFPRGAATQAGAYYEPCRIRLGGCPPSPDILIRALLLAPDSRAAKSRAAVEEIEEEVADIERDTRTAESGVSKLNAKATSGSVEHRFYDSHPQMWAVITDEYAFIEVYHYAPTVALCQKLRDVDLPAAQLDVNCTGGRVPVFQYSRRSNMWIALRVHFDHLWGIAKSPPSP